MSKPLPLPDLEYLRQILSYDEETGLFRWKRSKNGIQVGSIAGNKIKSGYIRIKIDFKDYLAHRIAWLFLTSADPLDKQIDHINCNRRDNRASNLRLASQGQNQSNSLLRKDNKSGYKGVYFFKQRGKWRASIRHNNKAIHLGLFDTPELAHFAYCKRAVELKGEFARNA